MRDECALPPDLTEADVLEAMRSMQGYVDITPGTFREIYVLAYGLACERVRAQGLAKDIMSTPVHCLNQDQNAVEAAAFMAEHKISGAPVVDKQGLVCGMVSEKDFLRHLDLPGPASFMAVLALCMQTSDCLVTNLRQLPIRKLMSSPVIQAGQDTSIAEISELFIRHNINHLPICNADGRVLGIVTQTDVVGFMCGSQA